MDIVGDAHELCRLFEGQLGTFDAAFAVSVFEHLLMPWRVALELNRVLRVGGLVFASTHQTWPPHEVPWDFWRYSDTAFDALFNSHTGFRIRSRAAGLPCTILPLGTDASMTGMLGQRAHLGVCVLAEKVSEPSASLRWDLTAADLVSTHYPGIGAAR